MTSAQREIAHLIDTHLVVSRRQRPDLAEAMQWLRRRGVLVSVLPGVCAPPASATSFDTLIAAVAAWRTDAVVVGAAAARLTFWPTIEVRTVDVAVPGRVKVSPSALRLSQRRVTPELVRRRAGGLVTAPELTALDLCATVGGDGIDRVLRLRAATLDQLKAALAATPNRRGNAERARLLLESRDEPWSRAERETHVLFRSAGLLGWTTNVRVDVDGSTFFLDIAFERLKVAIEIDGREFHSSVEAFEEDRHRQNVLTNVGWRVLRFTWRMLTEQPEWVVRVVRDAVESAAWMSR